ncbi:hypothetical protein LEP1GSC086_2958 [Leptospira weilii str. LNT 1234]|nr:hypothetical protein LEP1GSC086_2958 [Leptospira weilii str. LNT 1234]QDK24386.1 hypothetical protein FHG67_17990 [Leptospira weilii]QDK28346.1 hypothetical protein FHG68_18045 [Leptospira weilii]
MGRCLGRFRRFWDRFLIESKLYATIQFFIEVLSFETFILTVSISFFAKTFIGSKKLWLF